MYNYNYENYATAPACPVLSSASLGKYLFQRRAARSRSTRALAKSDNSDWLLLWETGVNTWQNCYGERNRPEHQNRVQQAIRVARSPGATAEQQILPIYKRRHYSIFTSTSNKRSTDHERIESADLIATVTAVEARDHPCCGPSRIAYSASSRPATQGIYIQPMHPQSSSTCED